MRIIYSKQFKRKSETPHYPLLGYSYSTISFSLKELNEVYMDIFDPTKFSYQILSDILINGVTGNATGVNLSSRFNCDTLIENNTCKVGFKFRDTLVNQDIKLIVFYYVDLLKYNKGVISNSEENDFRKNVDNVAAVMSTLNESSSNEDTIVNAVRNIIDMQYVPKCSFVNQQVIESNKNVVNHYQSSMINRAVYGRVKYTQQYENSMIESISGDELTRKLLGTENSEQLKGHMTMKTNGIIQL